VLSRVWDIKDVVEDQQFDDAPPPPVPVTAVDPIPVAVAGPDPIPDPEPNVAVDPVMEMEQDEVRIYTIPKIMLKIIHLYRMNYLIMCNENFPIMIIFSVCDKKVTSVGCILNFSIFTDFFGHCMLNNIIYASD
jgi:hypothetical protein